jgi:hypothetical protein
MKRLHPFLILLAVFSVSVALVWAAEETTWGQVKALTNPQPATKPVANDVIVSGGGILIFYTIPGEQKPWENALSFIAKFDKAGNPTGEGKLGVYNCGVPFSPPRTGGLPALHLKIDCLSVEGNMAWIGAAVTHYTNLPFWEALPTPLDRLIWQVEDNGEGNSVPDRGDIFPVADVIAYGLSGNCNDHPDILGLADKYDLGYSPEWSVGNVQILYK